MISCPQDTSREQGDRIRAFLRKLPTIKVGEDSYLKLEDGLNATEALLYPEGLQTQEEYNRLIAVTKAALMVTGFCDEEITLTPPLVSFRERGVYLKKLPQLTDSTIEAIIEHTVTHQQKWIRIPYIAIFQDIVMADTALKCWNKALSQLRKGEKRLLEKRCDQVAESLCFSIRSPSYDPHWPTGKIGYLKPMTPDIETLRQVLAERINSGSLYLPALKEVGLRAAFDSYVDQDPDGIIKEQTWQGVFDELGFIYLDEDTELIPKPLNLPPNAGQLLLTRFSSLTVYHHPYFGHFLLKSDVLKAATETLELAIPIFRQEGLLSEGIIGQTLIKLGYNTSGTWISSREVEKIRPTPSQKNYAYALQRTQQIKRETKNTQFAKGLSVYSPVFVRYKEKVVYIELLGPRQAVKANWAALRSKGRTHYFHGGRLEISKEDGMSTLKTNLPCGWDHWCLIHRQASIEKMTPNEPFYLIDDGEKPIPDFFIPFLAKSLSIPILPDWADFLWVRGRMGKLIEPLKNCYGKGGWLVESEQKKWTKIVEEGLKQKEITF